ncbi:thiamine-phosphate kinase [Dokdonella soli]|uniref:Thiamine-monophosphate kinase n=1 Tax=Dokdonella soli TaxID=529810 RepID=A0ABN1II20_9GAMM
MAEFDLIDLIHKRCAIERADVRLGIGDDAAILRPPPGLDLIVSTDTLVAGVHFPEMTSAQDLGWKSLAVNLSDLAAMGAMPVWALLALTLPDADRTFVEGFAGGFAELAAQHRVALVGGDTTRGPLTVTVVVHGFAPPAHVLRRDGAQIGDAVFVTGTLGDAAAGLRCLDPRDAQANALFHAPPETREWLISRLLRPTPRLAAGAALRELASACIDVSDGLLADLGHIAARSGVGIEIDALELPASSALLALFDAPDRLALQAGGGDDYELAFSVPPAHVADVQRDLARVGCGATRIGRVVAGQGVRLLDANGTPIALRRRGWDHFA